MPEPFKPPSTLQVHGGFHPGSIPATRLDGGLDELHSQDTVFDGREREGRAVEGGIVPAREDGIRRARVEVRKRFEESLRVTRPQSRRALRRRRKIAAATRKDAMRAVKWPEMELLRLLLDPLQARLLAEHPDALAMQVAGRGHADPHQSAGAVGEAQLHVGIVV